MKFVHIADTHLDSPFTTLNTKGSYGKIRRIDQREALKKVVEYIKENEIPYLFIAGDFYEHETIRNSTIQYVNNLFKTIPETKIFITPGNHDPYMKNSMYQNFNWSPNVKIFTSNIEVIESEEVDIYGVGFNNFYCTNLGIEDIEIKNKNKINILIVHGTLNGSENNPNEKNPISKAKLKGLGFDYIALGHIHKPDYNQEENQNIVYPGSTIAMGFDELGKHGFILGDIEKEKLDIKFIPIDDKEFKIIEVDITNINDQEELIEKLNTLELEENKLYEILLVGKRKFEIEILNLYKFITNSNLIKIKDQTKLAYSLEELKNDYTLKGIFVEEILEEMKSENYTEEELNKILEIGLSVLEK